MIKFSETNFAPPQLITIYVRRNQLNSTGLLVQNKKLNFLLIRQLLVYVSMGTLYKSL